MRDAVAVADGDLVPVDVHDLAAVIAHDHLVAHPDDVARHDEDSRHDALDEVLQAQRDHESRHTKRLHNAAHLDVEHVLAEEVHGDERDDHASDVEHQRDLARTRAGQASV